jgi:hypothetical protein
VVLTLYVALTAYIKRRDLVLTLDTIKALGSGLYSQAEVGRDGSVYYRRRSVGRTNDRTGYKRCIIFRTRTGDIKAVDSQEHLRVGSFLTNPVGSVMVALLWIWFRRNAKK